MSGLLDGEAEIAKMIRKKEEREAIQEAINQTKRMPPELRCGVLVQEYPEADVTDVLLSPTVPYGQIWRQQFKGEPPVDLDH